MHSTAFNLRDAVSVSGASDHDSWQAEIYQTILKRRGHWADMTATFAWLLRQVPSVRKQDGTQEGWEGSKTLSSLWLDSVFYVLGSFVLKRSKNLSLTSDNVQLTRKFRGPILRMVNWSRRIGRSDEPKQDFWGAVFRKNITNQYTVPPIIFPSKMRMDNSGILCSARWMTLRADLSPYGNNGEKYS